MAIKQNGEFSRKIFIGSSSEALNLDLVKKIGGIVSKAGIKPYPWNKIVKPGDVLLE